MQTWNILHFSFLIAEFYMIVWLIVMKRTRRSSLCMDNCDVFSLHPIICECISPAATLSPAQPTQNANHSNIASLTSSHCSPIHDMHFRTYTYICRCLPLCPWLQTIRRSGLGEGGGGIKVSRFPQLGGDKSWQCWCPLSRYQEMEICCTETHL